MLNYGGERGESKTGRWRQIVSSRKCVQPHTRTYHSSASTTSTNNKTLLRGNLRSERISKVHQINTWGITLKLGDLTASAAGRSGLSFQDGQC